MSNEALLNPLAATYFEQGYLFPVDVLSRQEALSHRRTLESLEARASGFKLGNKSQLNYPHVLFPFAHEIANHPRILDVVESIIGPDILIWGTTFFIKEPRTKGYVSWHQDLRYWGLDDHNAQVSAWVALSPVTRANGCMRFVPGSHQGELAPHNDTYADDNALTRGQEAAVEIDSNNITYVELEPGQASFHHGKLLHSSAHNDSDERRIGLTINYIAPHVRQTVAREDFAMLARGQDRYGHFRHVPAPTSDFTEDSQAWHRTILSAQNEAMYDGAQVTAG